MLIPVARELGTVGRIRINFTVSALSSLPGQDYLLPQEYVLMEDGQTGTQINVTLVDDATPELNEVLQFSLTSVELLDPPEVITLPPGASNPGNVEVSLLYSLPIGELVFVTLPDLFLRIGTGLW